MLNCEWYSSMIIKEIKIFFQNIYKNNLLTNTILEVQRDFNIIFIQEPCIGLTQENSIENSIQACLSYILIPNGPCKLFLAYPKWSCVYLKVNMCFTCCMTSFFQNLLSSSICHVTFVTMLSDVTCCVTVWSCHSNPNPSSKNRIKENKLKRK